MKKAVSPIISTVIIIAIVFGVATVVIPWAMDLAHQATVSTGNTTAQQTACQAVAYDFDTNYETDGIDANITTDGLNDTLNVRVVNTGTINVYNFSFELLINESGTLAIHNYDVNSTTQKTSANPLRPGESAILRAVITGDINGTLKEVKVNNIVCRSFYVRQEV